MDHQRQSFCEGSVRITAQRLIADGLIFDLETIHSVEFVVVKPRQIVAVATLVAGMLLLQDEGMLFVLGGFLVLFGTAAAWAAEPKYAIVLHTSFGVKRALLSKERAFVERVVQALDATMVHRSTQLDHGIREPMLAVHVPQSIEVAPNHPHAIQ